MVDIYVTPYIGDRKSEPPPRLGHVCQAHTNAIRKREILRAFSLNPQLRPGEKRLPIKCERCDKQADWLLTLK